MTFWLQRKYEDPVWAIPRIAELLTRLRVPRGHVRPSLNFRAQLISAWGATEAEADEIMEAVRNPKLAASKTEASHG